MESFRLKFNDHPTSEQQAARAQLASLFHIGPIICIIKLRLSSNDDLACNKGLEIDCTMCPIMQSFRTEDVSGVSHRIIATHERYGAEKRLK